MNSQFDIFYEVVDPVTQERFVTQDRFIAEVHYKEKHCLVYERHRTVTRHSAFNRTQTFAVLLWHDKDEDDNINPEIEED